jgi:RNA polymerase sigma factor (sigma-70 family)
LTGGAKYQHYTDQQLLEQFHASKDNTWLGYLLERYTLLLFGVCMKYLKNESEAKDAVQQVFLKCIAELHKYRVEYFKSWLYMVAKNHCLMQLRDKKGHHAEINDRMPLEADEGDTEAIQEKEVTLDLMNEALAELTPEQQQCVTLFYLQKQSYQQIGDATGYNYMQVKSYIQNGKRNLKILIAQKLKQKVR